MELQKGHTFFKIIKGEMETKDSSVTTDDVVISSGKASYMQAAPLKNCEHVHCHTDSEPTFYD